MPKRKRPDIDEPQGEGIEIEDRSLSIKSARLAASIENGNKLLHRALKLARGFERQKLGRRHKTASAQNNKTDSARLDKEVQALKALDLAIAAENHLFKQLIRTKRISELAIFKDYVAGKPSIRGPQDAAVANVTARLFNSNPVKVVMPQFMSKMYGVLGLEEHPSKFNSKGLGHFEGSDGKGQPTRRKSENLNIKEMSESELTSDWEGFASDGDENGKFQKNDDEELDMERCNSRIASASSDTGSDDHNSAKELSGVNQVSYDHSADLSLSSSHSNTSLSESPPASAAKGKGQKQTLKGTTFLPSLTVGGYWSGSESADDDSIAAVQPRKNRRGQQARRQLWEKMYGYKANHLKNQSRDTGWDLRKGATEGDQRGKRGRGRGGFRAEKSTSNGRGPQTTGSNSDPVKPRTSEKPQQAKPLHPSWEAARKAKEQKGAMAFQGKKITFD